LKLNFIHLFFVKIIFFLRAAQSTADVKKFKIILL